MTDRERQRQVNWAAEVFLDAMLLIAADKADDELVFLESALRELASHSNIDPDSFEVEPMTAKEVRAHVARGKARLAREGVG